MKEAKQSKHWFSHFIPFLSTVVAVILPVRRRVIANDGSESCDFLVLRATFDEGERAGGFVSFLARLSCPPVLPACLAVALEPRR